MSEPEFEFTDADPLPTILDDIEADGFSVTRGDTARFLRNDFAKPYLAVPGGSRFTWPVGVEGFEVNEDAEIAKHKYLGDLDLDVDVTHRGEETIVMTGTFPGWSSTKHMNALRAVFRAPSPQSGKVLSLPLILPTVAYVVCQSLRCTHATDDRTQDIEYTLTMSKVGSSAAGRGLASSSAGSSSPLPGAGGSGVQPTAPGLGSSGTVTTTDNLNTLRKVAEATMGDDGWWGGFYNSNKSYFDGLGIPTHDIPDYPIPPGTTLTMPSVNG